MSVEEMDDRIMALSQIEMPGFWNRIRGAAEILFRGNLVIRMDVEDFIVAMTDQLGGDTTCMLKATPEELMAPQHSLRDDDDKETVPLP